MQAIATTSALLALLETEEGVQLVEVLPASDHALEHLPGAVSIPLASLNRRSIAKLDPARPVVAYCFDYQ